MNKPEIMHLCQNLLNELSWDWTHPRIIDWLDRVGYHYSRKPYLPTSQLPDFVWISLAKYLDLRCKCEQLLTLLQWSWTHAEVVKLERQYYCTKKLPLKGYKQLLNLLDKKWYEEGGGF